MKKITLLILALFLSLSGFGQVFEEGFESPNPPTPPTWDLGTVNLGSNGIWGVFDNGVGLGQSWTVTTGSATPPLVYEGTASAFMQRENIGQGNTSQDYLATPRITIPANGQLRFFTRTGLNGDQGTKYKIMVAPSPDAAPVPQNVPANYVLVQEWTEATLVTTFNIYEEKVVDLSAYAGQKVYVAFVMEFTQPTPALGGDRWYVDKVRIGEKCSDPTNGTAVVGETQANLSWDANGAASWELEIIPFANNFSGLNTVTTNVPNYLATATTTPAAPLANGTPYKYYVRAICGNGFPSAWAGPYAFSTSSPGFTCQSPIVIPPGVPYSTTDNTANYGDTTDVAQPAACAGTATNYMTGNDVFYSYTPTTTGAISITMTPTANWSGIFVYDGCANVGIQCVAGVANSGNGVRSIPTLTVEAGHTYIIVISTNATPQTTGYQLVIQTLNCAPPNNLTAASTGPTSANLSWGNPGGASSWEVFVQPPSAPIPTTAGVTANTNTNFAVTAQGNGTPLVLGCYQYWVRANCGDGTFSPWAGPYPFCTTTCSSGCNYNFVMTDTFGDGWNGNTMTIAQGPVSTTIGSTFTTGTGPITVPVTLCDGEFTLTWNAGGSFPGEVGISVVNSFGQTIYVKAPGTGSPNSLLFTGTVDCSTPACLQPTGLTTSGFTDNSVTVDWAPAGPETSWQVIALPANSPAPASNATGWLLATNHPFVYPGLTIGTAYDFYVRAVCSETSNSPWAGPVKGNTSVCLAANQCPYTFTMVDSFGDSWNGGTMIVVQNGITVATLTGPTNAQGTTPVSVQVPLCHGVAFDLIWNVAGTFPGEMGITVTSFLGDVLFTKAPGTGSANATTPLYSGTGECIPPTCLKPTNVIVSNPTLNSITVAWTENNTPPSGSWDIIVLPATAPAPTASSTGWINVSTNPYTVTSLTAATKYKVYVRSVCSSSDSSFWSTGTAFNTQVCLPANTCEYTFNMWDSFGDSWNGNTMNITQNGILVATLTGPTNAQGTTVISQIVTLCNGIPFELFWNAGGGFPGEVGVSITNSTGTVIFTKNPGTGAQNTQLFTGTVSCVPVTCPKPVQVAATNITQTSALISWVESGSATAWEILILPYGSPTPIISGIQTGNPYLATGLTAGTAYTVYVRAICAANDISNWSVAYNFATPPVNDECSGAIFAPVNQDLSCNQVTSGTIIGATGSAPATNCSVGSNDDAWFFFTATAVSHIVSFNNTAGAVAYSYVVYSGGCGGLTQVFCSQDNSATVTGLTIGQTYYIRVFSESLLPQYVNQFNLCISTVPCATATPFCTGQVVTYANTTGVLPGLGQLGCLFTSPNPAFFFLQVSQAGPLNYLMTQSTTSGGAPNLDVDYALWGPFNSNEAACAVVPNNNPLSCSYSTAATESFSIANAQLCQIYVVMITNFSNQPGFITFTQTNPNGGGQTICYPFNTFNYSANQYCQNMPNPTPTLAPGAVAGTYTATPAGLVIDSATGQINLAASTPGNYVVTATTVPTTGGICPSIPNITTVRSVTITAVPDATISYAQAQYCNSQDAAVSVNQTGTTTGTYSSTPGLFINAQTGAIVPSLSTPGSYTVTYTIAAAGGCPAFTTTTPVEIILAPNIPFINNVTVCDSYTLPALTIGNYFTEPNGGGTQLNANDVISASQTIYVYATNSQCSDERSFTVTINQAPDLQPITDVTTCESSYLLPALAEGNYFTGPGGTGTALFANDAITTNQTIYVYAANGTCTDEVSFNVSFGILDVVTPGDTTVCDSYTLPTLSVGNYFTEPNGAGTQLNPNDVISSTQTIYVYAVSGSCTDEEAFTVTVNQTPDLQPITDVSTCESSYLLPALAEGNYFTGPAGTGTPLFANDAITADQTIYVYATNGTCSDEVSFNVTFGVLDVVTPGDVSTCDSYTLPALSVGGYFTAPDGGGTALFAGDSVSTTQTLWVYAVSGGCTDQESFTVTVNSVVADDLADVSGCNGYTLLPLSAGNSYYTGAGATGTQLFAGDVLTSSQTVYVWAESGTVPNCTDQSDFVVTIGAITAPVLNDVTVCDGYTLGALAPGNSYYTGPGATGTQLFAGDAVTQTQTVYVWAQLGTCTDQSSFIVTVNQTPVVADPADVSACDSYTLGVPSVGHYYGAAGGAGPILDNTTLTSSQTVWVYAATGTSPDCWAEQSFGVAITPSPQVQDEPDVTPCGSYTLGAPSVGHYYGAADGAGPILDNTTLASSQTVWIYASNGSCSDQESFQVTILSPPSFTIDSGCRGADYVLEVVPSQGQSSYQWSVSGGGQILQGDGTASVVVSGAGQYTVSVGAGDCVHSETVTLTGTACTIQKGISPNGDGLNDYFDLEGQNVSRLQIFNRYGTVVYKKSNYTTQWHGQSDGGAELPDGTYYYVAERAAGETKTGWIYINRERN